MELVVALDLPTPEENLALVKKFYDGSSCDIRCHFKIGLNTFIAGGSDFVQSVKEMFPVALDLKLYDIPNTMAGAATRICEMGVDLFTIHASSGEQGMSAVVKVVKDHVRANKLDVGPKILAVTILTSFTHEHCERVYNQGRSQGTQSLVELAVHAGVDGIVCAAPDLPKIDDWQIQTLEGHSKQSPKIKFIPGIELKPRDDDQQRKGTLKDMVMGGADYIVVGRPIYQADDPVGVALMIQDKVAAMEEAWAKIDDLTKWEEPGEWAKSSPDPVPAHESAVK